VQFFVNGLAAQPMFKVVCKSMTKKCIWVKVCRKPF